MSLKHCEKTRQLWKHTGRRIPEFRFCGFFGWGQIRWPETAWTPGSVRTSWKGIQHQGFPHLAIHEQWMVCPSTAHTSWPKPCSCHWWLHKPHHQQCVKSKFIPTFLSHLGTTKGIPWITLLGRYIASVCSWIFMISEQWTAIPRELLRGLSSQQAAIHSTLGEPPPWVRWETGGSSCEQPSWSQPGSPSTTSWAWPPGEVSLAPEASASSTMNWG